MSAPRPRSRMESSCPLKREARRVVRRARALAQAMNDLEAAQFCCLSCEAGEGDCPLLARYHQAIQEAIAEVTLEWGLAG